MFTTMLVNGKDFFDFPSLTATGFYDMNAPFDTVTDMKLLGDLLLTTVAVSDESNEDQFITFNIRDKFSPILLGNALFVGFRSGANTSYQNGITIHPQANVAYVTATQFPSKQLSLLSVRFSQSFGPTLAVFATVAPYSIDPPVFNNAVSYPVRARPDYSDGLVQLVTSSDTNGTWSAISVGGVGPWQRVVVSAPTRALRSNTVAFVIFPGTQDRLLATVTFYKKSSLSFDWLVTNSSGNLEFYVNGVLQDSISGTTPLATMTYNNLLPQTYTFEWRHTYNNGNAGQIAQVQNVAVCGFRIDQFAPSGAIAGESRLSTYRVDDNVPYSFDPLSNNTLCGLGALPRFAHGTINYVLTGVGSLNVFRGAGNEQKLVNFRKPINQPGFVYANIPSPFNAGSTFNVALNGGYLQISSDGLTRQISNMGNLNLPSLLANSDSLFFPNTVNMRVYASLIVICTIPAGGSATAFVDGTTAAGSPTLLSQLTSVQNNTGTASSTFTIVASGIVNLGNETSPASLQCFIVTSGGVTFGNGSITVEFVEFI